MSEPLLRREQAGDIATLTLNRPESMNALSRALRAELVRAFTEIEGDAGTRVVVLTGAGRAFCAGLDLKELGAERDADGDVAATIGRGADLVHVIESCRCPVIGAINGFAITGGFELALACDVLIASTEARFADTHARVGIMPGWGLSQKLSRAIGVMRAKELSLTGNFIDAEQAAAWGLVSRVVPPADLLPVAQGLAEDMCSCVPEVLREYKRVIDEGFATTMHEGRRIERDANRAHATTLTPEKIAARRDEVQRRGRRQSS